MNIGLLLLLEMVADFWGPLDLFGIRVAIHFCLAPGSSDITQKHLINLYSSRCSHQSELERFFCLYNLQQLEKSHATLDDSFNI